MLSFYFMIWVETNSKKKKKTAAGPGLNLHHLMHVFSVVVAHALQFIWNLVDFNHLSHLKKI